MAPPPFRGIERTKISDSYGDLDEDTPADFAEVTSLYQNDDGKAMFFCGRKGVSLLEGGKRFCLTSIVSYGVLLGTGGGKKPLCLAPASTE